MSKIIDQRDIYWVAGIIEGEGWLDKRNSTIGVRMTDLDIINRLHEVTGMGNVRGPYKGVNKPSWVWSVANKPEAARLALAIYPLMGDRRKAQIAELADRLLKQRTSREAPRIHGTVRMYKYELTQGIPTCDDCRFAANEESKKQRLSIKR